MPVKPVKVWPFLRLKCQVMKWKLWLLIQTLQRLMHSLMKLNKLPIQTG